MTGGDRKNKAGPAQPTAAGHEGDGEVVQTEEVTLWGDAIGGQGLKRVTGDCTPMLARNEMPCAGGRR